MCLHEQRSVATAHARCFGALTQIALTHNFDETPSGLCGDATRRRDRQKQRRRKPSANTHAGGMARDTIAPPCPLQCYVEKQRAPDPASRASVHASKIPGVRGSLSAAAMAKEGAPPTRPGTIPNPTTPMEPKHDISPAIPQNSPDHNLRITNGVNLGFNT
jgi:hypothetical protein